jgi:2-polyprenyl-3-methyl-5-hydroxy-6-metoxy-1,4-benzoquinol methylase
LKGTLGMKSFKQTQAAELDSWKPQEDKVMREMIRYPLLKKQMGLNYLDTSNMEVWDIGCGALGGVSSVINARKIVRIDPLGDEYAKYYPQTNMKAIKAEDLKESLIIPDLIIVTNALDHFDKPLEFLQHLSEYMKAGGFVSMLHAINNAYTHQHEAHAHNINPEIIHEYLDKDFEFVWELDFKHDNLVYGWKRQPAHSFLARKSTY